MNAKKLREARRLANAVYPKTAGIIDIWRGSGNPTGFYLDRSCRKRRTKVSESAVWAVSQRLPDPIGIAASLILDGEPAK